MAERLDVGVVSIGSGGAQNEVVTASGSMAHPLKCWIKDSALFYKFNPGLGAAFRVTGIPDPKHGERICVIYTDLGMSPVQLHQRLAAGPIPKVWVPSQRDFVHVAEIPITSTGKVDLRRLKQIAFDHAAGHAS